MITEIETCAKKIIDVIYENDFIKMKRNDVIDALRKDFNVIGVLPSSSEISELIVGDYHKVIPQSLRKKFSNLDKLLESYYTDI